MNTCDPRFCQWCGLVVREGSHHTNGDFDQYSVCVSEREIDEAIARSRWHTKARTETRYNIALGKHARSFG